MDTFEPLIRSSGRKWPKQTNRQTTDTGGSFWSIKMDSVNQPYDVALMQIKK